MKIVILNTSERTGGAAVAAGRLGKALGQAGIQVDKLVRENTWLNRFRFYWERLIIFLCNHLTVRICLRFLSPIPEWIYPDILW